MRIPDTAHTSRPWRIHEIAHDFRIEDVWALPTPGGPDDFPRLIRHVVTRLAAPPRSAAARALFAVRLRLGALFGWDRVDSGVGARVPTLRDRVPADLRPGPELELPSFSPVYRTDDEWAAELANRTVHAVLHLSWVPDGTGGGYRGQMAVLVKPNGLAGTVYMSAIAPFRHLVVYPALMRSVAQDWQHHPPQRDRREW